MKDAELCPKGKIKVYGKCIPNHRSDVIKQIQRTFNKEDKSDPFTNREYVEETNRIYKNLLTDHGDFDDATDKATYDIVMEILRQLGVNIYG
jgi:hypothetical protein